LAVDTDDFISIAKLRAGRDVFSRIAAACGAAGPVRLAATTSGRMLAAQDTWTNMIRLTVAGFAGAAGGADIVTLGCFSDPLGRPAALARHQSRNIQFVLMEETYIGRVADPAAGSGYVEALTDSLARAAWTQLQAIEGLGGAAQALTNGVVADAIVAAREARPAPQIVGVTVFAAADATPVAVDDDEPVRPRSSPPRLPGPDGQCPPLPPERLAI
jgi:methylmalonyl-CoA mutase